MSKRLRNRMEERELDKWPNFKLDRQGSWLWYLAEFLKEI
jgi:hypothetical protein